MPQEARRGQGERGARRCGDGSDRYALVPLGATLSEFAEGNPSEIPSRTQSVSAFLFGKFSKGPRSFGKTLCDLTHPLMENNRIQCSLNARSQGANLIAL
jgi:hypothetical protein